jgi:hypothetical protein
MKAPTKPTSSTIPTTKNKKFETIIKIEKVNKLMNKYYYFFLAAAIASSSFGNLPVDL